MAAVYSLREPRPCFVLSSLGGAPGDLGDGRSTDETCPEDIEDSSGLEAGGNWPQKVNTAAAWELPAPVTA